jgi:hypothetical protein
LFPGPLDFKVKMRINGSDNFYLLNNFFPCFFGVELFLNIFCINAIVGLIIIDA